MSPEYRAHIEFGEYFDKDYKLYLIYFLSVQLFYIAYLILKTMKQNIKIFIIKEKLIYKTIQNIKQLIFKIYLSFQNKCYNLKIEIIKKFIIQFLKVILKKINLNKLLNIKFQKKQNVIIIT